MTEQTEGVRWTTETIKYGAVHLLPFPDIISAVGWFQERQRRPFPSRRLTQSEQIDWIKTHPGKPIPVTTPDEFAPTSREKVAMYEWLSAHGTFGVREGNGRYAREFAIQERIMSTLPKLLTEIDDPQSKIRKELTELNTDDHLRNFLLHMREECPWLADEGPVPTGRQPPAHAQTHSADFTEVKWYGGEKYEFAYGAQSRVVQALWEEWEKGELGLHQDTIGQKIGSRSERFRLRDIFRVEKDGKRTMHPAWGTVIVEVGKGRFRLAPEKK